MTTTVGDGRVRLLLVEDSPADRALVEAYLRRSALADAEVARADRLAAAIAELEGDHLRRPDCVLLDLGLPDASGLEALQAVLRADPAAAVVVLTGNDDARQALDAVAAGAQDYLVKGSFDPISLERTVRYSVERARTTAELRRLEAELTRGHHRLAQAQRIARLGGWMRDPDSDTIELTDEAAVILGLTAGVLPLASLLDRVADDDRTDVERVLTSPEPTAGLARLVLPDGAERWVQVRVDATLDGAPAVGTFQDVTEREVAALDRENLAMLLEHAQRLESLGRLAGGIAHNFNNLLAAMRIQADLARFEVGPGSTAEAQLTDLLVTIDRAALLTRELLVFGRGGAASVGVYPVNDLVLAARSLLDQSLGDSVRLCLDLDERAGAVELDRSQLEQALLNLVINSRDAMPDGGTVTVTTRRRGPDLIDVTVSDTGTGMTPDVNARALEPFFTTKSAERGTGLGLSIVHGTVVQAGGGMEIETEVDRGTSVRMTLPASDQPAQDDPATRSDATPAVSVETVLVVDDQAELVALLETLLRRRGYQVVSATSAAAARVAAEQLDSVDLLLTDLVMPDVAGRELADELCERWEGLRVVYMSGYSDGQLDGVSLPAGAAFLSKPFASSELYATLDQVLGHDGATAADARD